MLWITIACWVAPLTFFAILAEYYFYCRKYKNQSTDKPECDAAYMPEWEKAECEKLQKDIDIETYLDCLYDDADRPVFDDDDEDVDDE